MEMKKQLPSSQPAPSVEIAMSTPDLPSRNNTSRKYSVNSIRNNDFGKTTVSSNQTSSSFAVNVINMQRHRRKDRTERAAPTIQKYLHGSIGGLCVSNSTPVPTTNENFYQPCVGGPSGKTGPPVCCRKDEILFQASPMPNPGCYPDDDPDGIEVYKEHHQQQASEVQYRGGELCTQQQRCHGKWYLTGDNQFSGEAGEMVYTRPTDGVPVDHHRDHQQQPHSCDANIQSTGGSTEYSYAYCEPILLQQRPIATSTTSAGNGSAEQQLTIIPVSNLASTGSSFCVPAYPQRQLPHHHHALPHPPPSLQRASCRQTTATRNHYQYAAGNGNNTTLTTLHHHHHHHHHHSNFTLPNPTTTTSTSTTGSLRALFSNIFRKSLSSATSSTSPAVPLAPIIDLGGDGSETLQHSMYGDDGASLLAAERHSFTTCYGTKENIYEDIGSQTGLVGAVVAGETGTQEQLAAGSSCGTPPSLSIPPPPPLPPPSGAGSPTGAAAATTAPASTGAVLSLADEWRRVQVQHERIIGELNLSVERLIMPSCYDEQEHQQQYQHQQQQQQQAQIQFHCCQEHTVSTENRVVVANIDSKHAPIAAIRTNTKHLYSAHTPTSSSSSPPPQLATSVGGLERHSPTVSYGKSYGDVDSGISSSSTSGTSYSSSILYRSITNYQQQQQHPHTSAKEQLNMCGGCPSQQQQQQHQSRAKPNLFNFRSGLTDGTTSGGRAAATCCRPSHEQSGGALPSVVGAEAALLTAASTNNSAIVTNTPASDLHAYACPSSVTGSYGRSMPRASYASSSSHTLTSWCFLSDHNLADRDISKTRPQASTFTYHRQQQQQQQERSTRSNFWTRFRKLRLPTAAGSKLFSSSDRQIEKIDAELHLEDFTGSAMWPEPGPRAPVYHRHQHKFNQQLPLDVSPHQHHHHHVLPSSVLPHGVGGAGEGEEPHLSQVQHHHQQQLSLHAFEGLEETNGEEPEGCGGETNKVTNVLPQPSQQPQQLQQKRSCSPSSSSSVASSSRSTSSAVSPFSPTSPGSSSSSCSRAKQSSHDTA